MRLKLKLVILITLFITLTGCSGKNNVTGGFPGKGADFPFTDYQSQDADYRGQLLEFNTEYHIVQSEASGRTAVKLQNNGDFVSFTLLQPANAFVLRYCMADSEDGSGLEGSLSIFVNGVKTGEVFLTSKYAWIYNYTGGWPGNKDPFSGKPVRFFDDSRMLFDEILPAGTEITFKKEDNIEYYIIDMVEFELVPPPLLQPENSLSITDFGAVPDGSNCRNAINDCIDAAKSRGKEVWIPPGNFTVSGSANIYVNNITVSGAGYWYSALTGGAYFTVRGNDNYFHDFAVFGDVVRREDYLSNCAFEAGRGDGNHYVNLWLEHVKCGFWVSGASNMVIKSCRIRNTFADGINLTGGTRDSIVENCDLRNNGDDSIAINSERQQNCVNNTVKNNTIRTPYHASGIAVYGGGDNTVQDNLIFDTLAFGAGINISSRFNPSDYHGTTVVSGNVLIRTGSPSSVSEKGVNQGAIWLAAWEKDISGVIFTGNRLIDSVCDGITIDGNGINTFSDIIFENNLIEKAEGYGIYVHNGAEGSISFKNVTVSGAAGGAFINNSNLTINKSKSNNWQ